MMKALTIKDPWAHAILSLGKNIENRTWRASELYMDQWIALHVSKTFDPHGPAAIDRILRQENAYDASIEWPQNVGNIIGMFHTKRVCEFHSSPWFEGPFGIVIDGTLKFDKPIPATGRLNFWTVPHDVEQKVLAQMKRQHQPATDEDEENDNW